MYTHTYTRTQTHKSGSHWSSPSDLTMMMTNIPIIKNSSRQAISLSVNRRLPI